MALTPSIVPSGHLMRNILPYVVWHHPRHTIGVAMHVALAGLGFM
jgi:hypothetical protein